MLYRFIKINLVFLFITIFAVSTFLPYIAAQENERGLTIRPAIIDAAVVGESGRATVTIANDSQNAIAVEANVEAFEIRDPLLNAAERNRYDISAWIELPKTSWVIPQDSFVEAEVIITPPDNSAPGGHYGQISFRILSDSSSLSGTTAEVLPEVRALVFVTVVGDIIEDLELSSNFERKFVLNNKVSAELSLFNTGNTHLLIQPFIKLRSFGYDQTVEVERGEAQIVTPGTNRTTVLEYQPNRLFARYLVWSEAIYGSPATTTSTQPIELIVISPWLILIVSSIFLTSILGLTMFRGSNRRLMYSSSLKKRSKRAGGYLHPRFSVEKKTIKKNK